MEQLNLCDELPPSGGSCEPGRVSAPCTAFSGPQPLRAAHQLKAPLCRDTY